MNIAAFIIYLTLFASTGDATGIPANNGAAPSDTAQTSDATKINNPAKPEDEHKNPPEPAIHEKAPESSAIAKEKLPSKKHLLSGKDSDEKPAVTHKFKPFGIFGFGSYGRVGFGSNKDGEPVYPVNITAHGPRLEESTYVELDFYYKYSPMRGIKTKTVATLALGNSLFHYDGKWDTSTAVRNLYLEVTSEKLKGVYLWVGSRMYRGDDIYLLDYWPLDNLNTLGAGIRYDRKPFRAGLHIGTNRVIGQYQYQEAEVNTPFVGEETIPTLNRQRTIASFKMEYWKQIPDSIGWKIKGYGEYHMLPSGIYNALSDEADRIYLPSEKGFAAGMQLGMWGFAPHSFINLFAKYSTGIAAYGEFSQPVGLGFSQDLNSGYSAADAREFLLAAVANYLIPGTFGVQFGSYFRSFKDADSLDYDWDDGYEITAAIRPFVWIPSLLGKNIALSGEISYQMTERNGLNPETELPAHPKVWKFSFLPTWIAGNNTYSRPLIRLVYTLAMPNDDAKLWYNKQDYRRTRDYEQFIGIQAEWWFNSSTYNN